ncbi:MAG TPA: hypothetical protein VFH59_06015 [Frateuria sp.]|uniref:hypothetical protein n=1 Tax=Frateuria sp. TaxID=2211372 RepID=UPI002D7F1A6B|nr:hypothetical protein [Frateuria sp.]HET6804986.1 hypothetical protein [Frateuria sp.]
MATDLTKAAASEAVTDVLRAIEDKLYESGLLVSATDDPEAEVTIAFRNVAVGGETVVALVIWVATGKPLDPAGPDWEPLRHYVLGKFASLQGALPGGLRERLLDCPGPLVFVNGASVD